MEKPTDPIVVFIQEYIEAHRFPPTQREISHACYLTLSATNKRLVTLSLAGCIERTPNQARGAALPKDSEPLPPAA